MSKQCRQFILNKQNKSSNQGFMTDINKSISMYAGMLRIRMVEEAIADRYSEQEMRCPVHLSIGQEGIAVGVCAALGQNDNVFSTHRAHAHYLAKGGDLNKMIAEIYGKSGGCSGGRGGSMHLVDLEVKFLGSTPIVGGTIPIGAGAAFSSWMRGENSVTAVFFGDGSTEEGVFYETLNFAALKNLPVIFVCENNMYSVYSPLSVRQPFNRDRVDIARAMGLYGVRGDGNDVNEVLQITQTAVLRARSGRGPTYLDLDTYRWREHCGPNYDNNLGYRTENEFLEWQKRCPVTRYASTLIRKNVLSEYDITKLKQEISREVEAAFEFAGKSPFPEKNDIQTNIYG
ncbi:MAG: thiamine pyrophosphate-dependent dehydrogenase E1 component subunit alpha [bacterium]